MYYFFEYVYPTMTDRRPLKTPGIVKMMFPREDVHAAWGDGRGLHSFPIQLNLSSSVHRITRLSS